MKTRQIASISSLFVFLSLITISEAHAQGPYYLNNVEKLFLYPSTNVSDGTAFFRTSSNILRLNYKGSYITRALDNSNFEIQDMNDAPLFVVDPSNASTPFTFNKFVTLQDVYNDGSNYTRLFFNKEDGTPIGYIGHNGQAMRVASTTSNGFVAVFTNSVEAARFDGNGNLGIGTVTPDFKLTVNGKIKAEEVQVVVDVPADYVFEDDYYLRPLEDVETYVKAHKHLPGVPSAAELREQGWQVGEMNNLLLEKVEELTLYMIELKKENERIREELQAMQNTKK